MQVVLVVDDDARVRAALVRLVGQRGHVVVEAASAEEAVAVLERGSVSVVISDLHMSGMGGEGLLRELQARGIGVPVVIFSAALGGDLFRQRLVTLGAARLCAKPDAAALMLVLDDLLGSGQRKFS
jgi:CheY-like chemotaxis protein